MSKIIMRGNYALLVVLFATRFWACDAATCSRGVYRPPLLLAAIDADGEMDSPARVDDAKGNQKGNAFPRLRHAWRTVSRTKLMILVLARAAFAL